jgi:SWIM/SEC-C metal-binding protein
MAKLGSDKNPLVCRVRSMERVEQVARVCEEHGWHYICGVEPDKPEDISDLQRMLKGGGPILRTSREPGRNAPCPCGSGRKYKDCCG